MHIHYPVYFYKFDQFYYGNFFHKHNSICVSFFLMHNCQNGLAFVNFNLKLLLGC